MEVKSNVKQRRMDRMKQLSESGHMQDQQVIQSRNQLPRVSGQSVKETFFEPDDLRFQDPEFAWKQRDRFRNENASSWRPVSHNYEEFEKKRGGWLKPPSGRQLWVKLGVAAVLFAVSFATFQTDHPYALQGRQWITKALTEDYNFAGAAAWYESKFSGLPAILPAFWRHEAPETQKASAVNARQLYAPVIGKIIIPFTEAEPMIRLETTSGDVRAMDSGRIVTVQVGADNLTQIVIQHADGLQTTYTGLAQSAVKRYDWIKGGETIGRLVTDSSQVRTSRLGFAVKKDNQWIDPTDVVPFG
ncbi:MAG: peptidase [Paenibacillus sp.]|jgi:stage IV sporulation protein FA|nr:peptidase [Paenibacillus sp.]